MIPDVVICQKDGITYPSNWDPSVSYPEYPFKGAINQTDNHAYAMVRECLRLLGLDSVHFSTSEWNPLGDLVAPGQTVVIKPNLVLHVNKNKKAGKHGMDCLVTHPSVIRAVCDYCIIALKGRGRIIIGDAPVQDCDLKALFERMGYTKIIEFYRGHGIDIVSFEDFRAYHTRLNKMHVICDKKVNSEGVEVDLGNLSAQKAELGGNYVQVANYDRRVTTAYHSEGRHIYSIARTALGADLIINLPKPKSHRLAGMTGAMKNFVGIACNKETLPHRTSGDSAAGGDSYLNRSLLKRIADYGLNLKTYQESEGKTARAAFTWLWAGLFCFLSKHFAQDSFLLGSWPGNDTIWRTIVDLDYIMTFCTKTGELSSVPQRRFLTIVDGIISGEEAGPLRPSPKMLGALVAGLDMAQIDSVLAKIMGFPVDKIPLLRKVCSNGTRIAYREPLVLMSENGGPVVSKCLTDMHFNKMWFFKPHPSWNNELGA